MELLYQATVLVSGGREGRARSEQAKALVEAAHLVCPYSRALTGTVEPRINVTNS